MTMSIYSISVFLNYIHEHMLRLYSNQQQQSSIISVESIETVLLTSFGWLNKRAVESPNCTRSPVHQESHTTTV